MVLMSFWSVTCGLVTDTWNDPVYYIISIQYYMKYCNCYWTVWIPNMIKLRKHFWHGCLSCGYPIGMSDASPKNLLSHTFFNTHTKIVVYYISCNLKCVFFLPLLDPAEQGFDPEIANRATLNCWRHAWWHIGTGFHVGAWWVLTLGDIEAHIILRSSTDCLFSL